jgi:hypothetical protein
MFDAIPRAFTRQRDWTTERLDTLSLQVRAFNGLLELRRERALELADSIEVRFQP